MSSNYIKEEKKKKYTKTKAMSKYKSKLNKNANPYFPKENNIGENTNIKQQTDLYQEQNISNENESISQNHDKLDENIKKYSYETLKVFGDLQISKETNLLTEDALEHINQMYIFLSSIKMDNLLNKNGHSDSNNNNNYSNCDTSKSSGSSNIMSLELWSRPDYTKETEEAENNKKIFDKKDKIDSIKKDLRELLNSMTKDNYEIIKNKILEIIKDKIENQDKFIDIIFLKSISEESYVGVYAKLIKDLNDELPQKIEVKYNNKNKVRTKITTSFTDKLIKKCKEMMKFKEKKKYEEYFKEITEIENEEKIKKMILGNSLLICELIKYELLPKKSACDCIDYSFNKYDNSENSAIKNLSIQLIINFVSNLGALIQNEEDKKSKKIIRIQRKIDEAFEKLDEIKENQNIPSYIKYSIINLIKKKENNYEPSKFEKHKIAKSKKELEDENKNKIEVKNLKEKEEINQDEINELLKNDLFKYKQLVESEGSSEKFSWEVTTVLYDYKLKKFDSILEGYFMGCLEFIDKIGNANFQYAKDYIKEIVEYYQDKMTETEKKSLINNIYELYEIIKDNSLDIPDIFKIYEYVIEILIENDIIKYDDLCRIFETKMNNTEDSNILNNMFRNIYNNIKTDNNK